MMKLEIVCAFSLLAALTAGCAAPAADKGTGSEDQAATTSFGADHYYVSMFGYQDPQNSAPLSHTFASFLHVGSSVEVQTISWLPETFTGEVCVDVFHLRCGRVAGHNYTLEETLAFAQSGGEFVGMYGPFEISPDLWNRATNQVAYLNSGATSYIANDLGFHMASFNHRGGAINCIHAVSDALYFDRTGLNWGLNGSHIVLDNMAPWLLSTTPAEDVVQYFPIDGFAVTRLAY
jgi:hypothetical protein